MFYLGLLQRLLVAGLFCLSMAALTWWVI